MNTQDQEYQYDMYIRLINASRQYSDGFNMKYVLDAFERITNTRHCGNGYWSWDGMLDDLTELVGNEDIASEILNNC